MPALDAHVATVSQKRLCISAVTRGKLLYGLKPEDGARRLAQLVGAQGLHANGVGAAGLGRSGRPTVLWDCRNCHPQSACFLKNAGISISSMPLLDSASTLAAALCERAVRHTLGVLRLL